jgi:hypothetical protein
LRENKEEKKEHTGQIKYGASKNKNLWGIKEHCHWSKKTSDKIERNLKNTYLIRN